MKNRIKKYYEENQDRINAYLCGFVVGGIFVAVQMYRNEIASADLLTPEGGEKMIVLFQRNNKIRTFTKTEK